MNTYNTGAIAHWNPWYGCAKVSEGCQNCFIKAQKILIPYPITFNVNIKNTKNIIVSLNTDFFLEEADDYRNEAWEIIKNHPELRFIIITKRPERVNDHLPEDWNDGYDNVVIAVTCENQRCSDLRLPILKEMNCKHKWITCSPMLEEIHIEDYLAKGFIEHVECGGEKFTTSPREIRYEWVKSLRDQCEKYKVNMTFMYSGYKFLKDGHYLFDSGQCFNSYIAEFCKELNYRNENSDFEV